MDNNIFASGEEPTITTSTAAKAAALKHRSTPEAVSVKSVKLTPSALEVLLAELRNDAPEAGESRDRFFCGRLEEDLTRASFWAASSALLILRFFSFPPS